MKERVQKILASAGVGSRRKVEEMIAEGRVRVNGEVISLGDKADPVKDIIKVGNRRIYSSEPRIYIAMNKPRSVITSASDPEGRKTVLDLLPGIRIRVFPVGRLDYQSEGLLILTNDGDLANRLMHPSSETGKVYRVKIQGQLEAVALSRLRKGVRLDDGMTAPARVTVLETGEKSSWIELTIHEGRNRQVRRMLEAVGHRVQRLRRVSIGPIGLGKLRAGESRMLTDDEVRQLRKSTSAKPEGGRRK